MLSSKQLQCIKYMVSTKLQQKDIARQIDIAEETISRWKSDEEFLKELETATRRMISASAAKAARKIEDLMENAENDQVKLAAAKDILDRAGFKPKDSVSVELSKSDKLNDIIEQLGGEGLEE